jgi:hypothetical protein
VGFEIVSIVTFFLNYSQWFPRNLPIQNFLYPPAADDLLAALEIGFDVRHPDRRIIERHEKTFLGIFASSNLMGV